MAAIFILFVLFALLASQRAVQPCKPSQLFNNHLVQGQVARIEANYPPFLWNGRIKLVRTPTRENNHSRFAYPVLKSSKHGVTCLHLPGKEIFQDLTIYMDVEINPGPSLRSPTEITEQQEILHSTRVHVHCTTPRYTRDQFISLRHFSTRSLTPSLLPILKNLHILRLRGSKAFRQSLS